MKKGLMISILTASLLSTASIASERMASDYMGFSDIIEHSEEMGEYNLTDEYNLTKEEYKEKEEYEYKEEHEYKDKKDYEEELKDSYHNLLEENLTNLNQDEFKHIEKIEYEIDYENEKEIKEEFKKEHILYEIEDEMKNPYLPEDVKEVLKEVKKAIEFYKKEELFTDVNLTQLDEETLQKLQEKAKEAYKERVKEIEEHILKNQHQARYPIAGEFVSYGEGPYDWVFVTTTGQVFKLDGVDPNTGSFKYTPLPGVQGYIDQNGEVSFEVSSNDPLALKLSTMKKQGVPFAKYDDPNENGFDWIVVTSDGRVYKLEGFDEDSQSFVYTPVETIEAQQEDGEVVLLPGQG